jgi:hypothetical protein
MKSRPTRKAILMKELSTRLTRVRSAGSACQSGSSTLLLKPRMDCIFLWAVVFIGFNSYNPAIDSALAVFFFSTKLSLGGD